jgi:hypothetical protein
MIRRTKNKVHVLPTVPLAFRRQDPTNGASMGKAFRSGQKRNVVFKVEAADGNCYVVKVEPHTQFAWDTYQDMLIATRDGPIEGMVEPLHLSALQADNAVFIRTVYHFIEGQHPQFGCLDLAEGKKLFARHADVMRRCRFPHMDCQALNLFLHTDALGAKLVMIDMVDSSKGGGCTDHLSADFKLQQNHIFFQSDLPYKEYQLVCLFYAIFAHMVGLDRDGVQDLLNDKSFASQFPAVCGQVQRAMDYVSSVPEEDNSIHVPLFLQ